MTRRDLELGGAPEGLDALVVAERLKAQGGLGLFVARDYQRAGNFRQALAFFAKDIEVLDFPAWDCLPYDRLSPTASIAANTESGAGFFRTPPASFSPMATSTKSPK